MLEGLRSTVLADFRTAFPSNLPCPAKWCQSESNFDRTALQTFGSALQCAEV